MRICYVAHSNAHFVVPYIEFFSKRGHEVHLVSLHRDDVPNAIMHHPAGRSFDPMTDKLTYIWAPWKVRRVVQKIKPDLVHAHYLTSNGVMAALAGCQPLVVSARGTDVYHAVGHPIKRRLVCFAMNRARLVNPVSRDLEKHILALGIPASKVLCLSQGVETDQFMADRSIRRAGPIRMICTRKLFAFYQCDLIAKALGMLAARGLEFHFTFAATGPQEPELREMVQACGLCDRVRFVGGYRMEELPPMLADADLYVSASPWDGTSPALLEAMASGLFPVVSDIVANREWLSGRDDALLFPVGDVDALVGCLGRAIADEVLRRGAIEGNRKRVQERGDRARNLEILARHYERLVAGG